VRRVDSDNVRPWCDDEVLSKTTELKVKKMIVLAVADP
jgi:hypothetical protein